MCKYRIGSMVLCVLLLLTMVPFAGIVSAEELPAASAGTTETVAAGSYIAYSEKHGDKKAPQAEIVVSADQQVALNGAQLVQETVNGQAKDVLSFAPGHAASLQVEIPATGIYYLSMTYRVNEQEDIIGQMEVSLQIDGQVPFMEADALKIDRPWIKKVEHSEYSDTPIVSQEGSDVWVTADMLDPSGRFNTPLGFYLTAGTHVITVTDVRGTFLLDTLTVTSPAALKTYDKVEKDYPTTNKKNEFVGFYQGEDYSLKADSTLTANNDPSDPDTLISNPDSDGDSVYLHNSPEDQLLNYMPGSKFKTVGQWIEWEIEVPQDGLYGMTMRVRQNYHNGLSSYRRLLIDGEVPMKECDALAFHYDNGWYMQQIGKTTENEKGKETVEPYWFYLTAGKHVLRLEVVPGAMSSTRMNLSDIIAEMNVLYNDIISITGNRIDKYRDYNLDELVPDLEKRIKKFVKSLEKEKEYIVEQSGGSGSEMANLQALINLLNVFVENDSKIPQKLNNYRSYIESLASWNSNLLYQSLDIDYITVYGKDATVPKAQVNFFESLKFDIARLYYSFINDYSNIGGANDKVSSNITVWGIGGRDQLMIINELIQQDFTPKTGIGITLATGTDTTSAVLAGKAPDVSLFSAADGVSSYAHRGNVLADLTKMEGYEEVSKRFASEAMVPATFRGGVYGLPLTMGWSMMFVRKDILDTYELKVPETWDDIYHAAKVLHRNHREIGIGTDTGTFFTLLLQEGGQLFDENYKTELEQQPALNAFTRWTSFFSKHGFPLAYDFYNRFRSGEMPIGMASYTMYAQLDIMAPEIQGLWEMHPIPGIRQADGSISRLQSVSAGTGATFSSGLAQGFAYGVIFEDSKDHAAAWKFLDWFTSAEVQADYGYGIEAALGTTGRYTPANLEALKMLPWDADVLQMLEASRGNVRAFEEVPGNYYIIREVVNAFRSVLYKNTYPVETLCQYNTKILAELERKHKEYNIGIGN